MTEYLSGWDEYEICRGCTVRLFDWNGDYDFTDRRDVTGYPNWICEIDPDAAEPKNPPDTQLVWRIIARESYTVGQAPFRVVTVSAGSVYALGPVRGKTLRGALMGGIKYGQISPQLGEFFGFANFSEQWKFNGSITWTGGFGFDAGEYDFPWRLEIGAYRCECRGAFRVGEDDFDGYISWPRKPVGSEFPAPDEPESRAANDIELAAALWCGEFADQASPPRCDVGMLRWYPNWYDGHATLQVKSGKYPHTATLGGWADRSGGTSPVGGGPAYRPGASFQDVDLSKVKAVFIEQRVATGLREGDAPDYTVLREWLTSEPGRLLIVTGEILNATVNKTNELLAGVGSGMSIGTQHPTPFSNVDFELTVNSNVVSGAPWDVGAISIGGSFLGDRVLEISGGTVLLEGYYCYTIKSTNVTRCGEELNTWLEKQGSDTYPIDFPLVSYASVSGSYVVFCPSNTPATFSPGDPTSRQGPVIPWEADFWDPIYEAVTGLETA